MCLTATRNNITSSANVHVAGHVMPYYAHLLPPLFKLQATLKNILLKNAIFFLKPVPQYVIENGKII